MIPKMKKLFERSAFCHFFNRFKRTKISLTEYNSYQCYKFCFTMRKEKISFKIALLSKQSVMYKQVLRRNKFLLYF